MAILVALVLGRLDEKGYARNLGLDCVNNDRVTFMVAICNVMATDMLPPPLMDKLRDNGMVASFARQVRGRKKG